MPTLPQRMDRSVGSQTPPITGAACTYAIVIGSSSMTTFYGTGGGITQFCRNMGKFTINKAAGGSNAVAHLNTQLNTALALLPAGARAVVFIGFSFWNYSATWSTTLFNAHRAAVEAGCARLVGLGHIPVIVQSPVTNASSSADALAFRSSECDWFRDSLYNTFSPFTPLFDPSTGVYYAGVSSDGAHPDLAAATRVIQSQLNPAWFLNLKQFRTVLTWDSSRLGVSSQTTGFTLALQRLFSTSMLSEAAETLNSFAVAIRVKYADSSLRPGRTMSVVNGSGGATRLIPGATGFTMTTEDAAAVTGSATGITWTNYNTVILSYNAFNGLWQASANGSVVINATDVYATQMIQSVLISEPAASSTTHLNKVQYWNRPLWATEHSQVHTGMTGATGLSSGCMGSMEFGPGDLSDGVLAPRMLINDGISISGGGSLAFL